MHRHKTKMLHYTYVLYFLTAEWIQQYTSTFIHPEKLQEIVDSFMKDYDKRKEEVSVLPLFLQLS